jgi:hypothetical protein
MADYNYLSDGRPAGTVLGNSASDLVGFYGTTPVVQRATATTHTTTNMVTSASFGATQVAIVQEIMNTLIANGLWAA